MKKNILLLLLLLSLNCFAQNDKATNRINQLFNFGWKFQAGSVPGAEALNYDDKSWRQLDLPHDFQFEQPWDKSASAARGFKQMGEGWYRKTFKADPSWKGKKIILDFEGIMLTGEAWLNGKPIGSADY